MLAEDKSFRSSEGLSDVEGQAPDLFKVMAEELARARANKVFPPTTASSTDVEATAHDYELLLQLQHFRLSNRPEDAESYGHMFVDIARRIRDRDDACDGQATRDEVIRRVESYIRSVEHEKEHFESVRYSSASDSSPPTPMSLCSGGCSPAETKEEMLSVCGQAAERAMYDVARPLMEGVELYAELHDEQQGLSNEQKALHHQHVALVVDQKHILNYQADMFSRSESLLDRLGQHSDHQELAVIDMEEHVQHLRMMTEDSARNIVALQHTLNVSAAATSQLSQTVANLPQAIQHIVNAAVQQQTNMAIVNICKAYKTAVNEIEEQKLVHLQDTLGSDRASNTCCHPGNLPPDGKRTQQRGWRRPYTVISKCTKSAVDKVLKIGKRR